MDTGASAAAVDLVSCTTPARETIAALSTAPGRAAIAVIRISGPAAGAVLDALAAPRPEPRRAALRAFRDPSSGEILDHGLALWLPGPGSATGEDMAELQVHGGTAVVAAALGAALSVAGVRAAEPGEFTRRAFLAGRLDLAEAEGLADLLAAETERQRRQALLQSSGALSDRIDGWRTRLIEAMALVEAGIDFSDEPDVPARTRTDARAIVGALAPELAAALADRSAGRVRDGFRVAILGRPNAGKSSLLNAIARRDAAIVAETPGTTRDAVEVRLDLSGLPVALVDTAGLREAEDAAEREGVRRALVQADAADVVLWVEDALDRADPPPTAGRVLRVLNKADLLAGATPQDCDMTISTRTGAGLDALVAAIAAAASDAAGGGDGAGLTRARHRDAVAACLDHLREALDAWDALPDELIAEALRGAATELGRITGRVGVEDVLDRVFASFCIGK